MEYKGISPDILFLADQNRFENSKSFYKAHKQELKDGFTVPMRQIAAALSPQMILLDDKMMTNPVYMVSKIRRDNRYTKDKSLYRDHLWIMFMRNKHEWVNYPCMWFEVGQQCWGYGVGMYYVDAAYLELYRKALLERPQEFLSAVKKVESTGAVFSAEYYKKPKPGNPSKEIEPYYNIKYMSFFRARTDYTELQNPDLPTELGKIFRQYEPMYKFLKSVSDERVML
ncbi:MAG: DUF2461 domain-containing protein [Clostridia bacterium]|nr:DUF2461 domain-containing protein [Clostridia bacterium]